MKSLMPRRGTIPVVLSCLLSLSVPFGSARCRTWRVAPGDGGVCTSLQRFIDTAAGGDTLVLARGIYRASSVHLVDSLCGNCGEHATVVPATAGFVVRGKGIVVVGGGARETVIETGAGYGVYFEGSHGSVLQGLTVTGGLRDADPNATDAAVVVRRSSVTVTGCRIEDNTSRIDTVVVGIGGVFGREGAELFVANNIIRNNGWDGIALYRGATAFIADNVISEGRGAGVGVTWDAVAVVYRNRISGYWKGIGTFGDGRAVVRGNAVYDNLGWGIIATGTSHLDASNNVVYHNGNCGLAVWSETCTARFTNNVVAANGFRDEWVCPRVGVWVNGTNDNAEFSYNDVWGNAAGEYGGVEDMTGKAGNISIDPGLADAPPFMLPPGSPLRDAGNPLLTDPDGTRSDIGIGPHSGGSPCAR